AMVWPFVFLDRHVPAVRKHGYLLATVVTKADRPASEASTILPPEGAPMKTAATLLFALALGGEAYAASASAPLLLQHPTLSKDSIAFDFAGEIWTVPREGGTARRLVAGQG